jgi:hypothetical protein
MPPLSSPYTERLAKIRRQSPNAYKLWTVEDEQRLLQGIQGGESVESLAIELKRQPSAIRSRLHRLGGREVIRSVSPTPDYSQNKPINNVIQQSLAHLRKPLQVVFEAEWHRVESTPGIPYKFPSPPSDHMLAAYGCGCLYRWGVYLLATHELYAIYIGSTKRLCPDRLDGYLNPKDSATNRRIYSQLISFQDHGYPVSLEILQQGRIILNDFPLDFLDFETQRDRLFLENLLFTYYRLQGQRLLNL